MNRRQLLITGGFVVCGSRISAVAAEDVRIARFGEPVDISGIPPGSWCILLINGTAVFVRHRTREQIRCAHAEELALLPDPALDEDRAIEAQWLVVSAECTHAGCRVSAGQGPYQGWECFCHGSQFDLSGRVRRGPAKRNLVALAYDRLDSSNLMLREP